MTVELRLVKGWFKLEAWSFNWGWTMTLHFVEICCILMNEGIAMVSINISWINQSLNANDSNAWSSAKQPWLCRWQWQLIIANCSCKIHSVPVTYHVTSLATITSRYDTLLDSAISDCRWELLPLSYIRQSGCKTTLFFAHHIVNDFDSMRYFY